MAKGEAKARKSAGLDPRTGKAPSLAEQAKAKRRALRVSRARFGTRIAASGLVAGAVGLASGLWNWRHPGKAWGHMRTVWARLAGRARDAREVRDAKACGERVPADHVNDPARKEEAGREEPGTGGKATKVALGKSNVGEEFEVSDTTGTAFTRLSDAAEVMLQAAQTFDPEHMPEFQQLIEDLPTAMATVQEVLRVLAEISRENLPVDAAVVEEMGEGFRAMNRVVSSLEEVPVVYRRVHVADLERSENPRNGIEAERKWNV
ncbi:hypothetical protein [Streptomyces sp. SBT349]|uniref:hypothetical protein n=1 Tax=Streptomyces sp. SBT349 TaxID=1580539 RepID=UPI00066E0603|nr:hypothetical protein [Streptomyces sp. SBT349]